MMFLLTPTTKYEALKIMISQIEDLNCSIEDFMYAVNLVDGAHGIDAESQDEVVERLVSRFKYLLKTISS